MPTPDFILELRTMIGHHPLWLPGVTALVTRADGWILLGQRVDNGLWALPSGISDPGEAMAAACEREILEETGIEAEAVSLIALRTIDPITYPNGDVTSYVDHFFRCRPLRGTAQVGDDESLAVGWFDPAALPEPLMPSTHDLLKLAAEHERTGRTSFDR